LNAFSVYREPTKVKNVGGIDHNLSELMSHYYELFIELGIKDPFAISLNESDLCWDSESYA